MNRFVILNGEVVEKDEINLSFLFWEDKTVVAQKIWFGFGGIPLFNENVDLLIQQIEILKLPCPELLKNKRELFRITKRILNKNKFYRSGYIYLQFFWNNDKKNMLISSEPFNTFDFQLLEKGILVNYSEFKKLSKNKLNRFCFFNETLWKVAAAQNRGTLFQNSIILNENNSVCESIAANLFFIKGEKLVTPSLQTGCYEDTLRKIILEITKGMGLEIAESGEIKKEDLFYADELFLAGEELGIQWILGVENKRFVHKYSEQIHKKLNEHLKEKAGK